MNTPELLAALRSWAEANCPGLLPSHVVLHFFNSLTPLQLPFGTAIAAPAQTQSIEGQRKEDKTGNGLSPVILDILATLREVGKPLTTTRLIEEMEKRRRHWSERTIAGYLARLVQDGALENDPNAKPRGYRLTDTNGDA